MDLSEGIDRLVACPTQGTISDALGIDVQRIRQARLAEGHPNRRPAPDGWEKPIAKLARERAGELVKLAEELEG